MYGYIVVTKSFDEASRRQSIIAVTMYYKM